MNQLTYPPLSRFFHWLIALLLLINLLLGVSLGYMQLSPEKLQRITWHKWMGITILCLVTLRLINRLLSRMPPLEPAPRWQQTVAKLVHFALYLVMFAIPISGWCISSAAGIPVIYLNLWELPALLPKNRAWVDTLKEVHESLNITMVVLVSVHVLAALKHHLHDRDATLVRMLPILKRSSQ
jgi:cytochrome b561